MFFGMVIFAHARQPLPLWRDYGKHQPQIAARIVVPPPICQHRAIPGNYLAEITTRLHAGGAMTHSYELEVTPPPDESGGRLRAHLS